MPITKEEKLINCEPCPPGSSRRNRNATECTCRRESRSASQPESADTACEPCPTGSNRTNFTDIDCTCSLDYRPVMDVDGRLERCETCPSGSRRMSLEVSDCTCEPDYFRNGTSEPIVCDPCPAGSGRSLEDVECTCESQYYPNRTDGILLVCVPCPLNSLRLNLEDDNCTCSGNSITESETDTTTNEPCNSMLYVMIREYTSHSKNKEVIYSLYMRA